jgi:hypothetical protein
MAAKTTSLRPTVTPPIRGAIDRQDWRRVRAALWCVLTDILASPKGDQGGWEAGARGL